jgi:hypothetical protein
MSDAQMLALMTVIIHSALMHAFHVSPSGDADPPEWNDVMPEAYEILLAAKKYCGDPP